MYDNKHESNAFMRRFFKCQRTHLPAGLGSLAELGSNSFSTLLPFAEPLWPLWSSLVLVLSVAHGGAVISAVFSLLGLRGWGAVSLFVGGDLLLNLLSLLDELLSLADWLLSLDLSLRVDAGGEWLSLLFARRLDLGRGDLRCAVLSLPGDCLLSPLLRLLSSLFGDLYWAGKRRLGL